MLEWLIKLPIRKRVGILAIILGFLAIFLGEPSNNIYSKVNLEEVALKSISKSNRIDPIKLANWIIKGNQDYYLLDLRNSDEFEKYHIPTAISVPVQKLVKSGIPRNSVVILYADNQLNTATGWFLLKAEKYKSVNILDGGLQAWKDKVLFPAIPQNATSEQKTDYAKIVEISKFFGGQPQTGMNSKKEIKRVMPKLSNPKHIILKKHKKKKREGC